MSALPSEIEERILQRIDKPGWVATRGLVSEPDDPSAQHEYGIIEDIMKSLAHRGVVELWRISLLDGGQSYLAAARPELKLDKDLEQRGAWATAEKYVLEE
jgi:hypothetical protein